MMLSHRIDIQLAMLCLKASVLDTKERMNARGYQCKLAASFIMCNRLDVNHVHCTVEKEGKKERRKEGGWDDG